MDKYFTVVKIVPADSNYRITDRDVQHWREIFANNPEEVERATETGEVFVEKVPIPENEQYVTLVKIGDHTYTPTTHDLEAWREVFEEAKKDPTNFKIFTHPAVEINVINIGKIITVE